MTEICPIVNGVPLCVRVEPGSTLRDVRRDQLARTGAKAGCLEDVAISRAIGVRVRRLPATPERVFRAPRGGAPA
jgi:aerobic-type carbon monoxide dehydrogenase small subunit (CoxS/CutS family)